MSTDLVTPQRVAADIAREYRENPKHWTQGDWGRDARGHGVGPRSPTAVCWCLRSAIDKRVEFPFAQEVYEAFELALGHVPTYDKLHFVAWNDQWDRTVDEVIALCDKVAAS